MRPVKASRDGFVLLDEHELQRQMLDRKCQSPSIFFWLASTQPAESTVVAMMMAASKVLFTFCSCVLSILLMSTRIPRILEFRLFPTEISTALNYVLL